MIIFYSSFRYIFSQGICSKRIWGQHPFCATWASWLLTFFVLFFRKKDMWGPLFNFVFTTSQISNVVLDTFAEGVLLYAITKASPCSVSYNGRIPMWALVSSFIQKCFVCTEHILFGRAEQHSLGLDHACDLAFHNLLAVWWQWVNSSSSEQKFCHF